MKGKFFYSICLFSVAVTYHTAFAYNISKEQVTVSPGAEGGLRDKKISNTPRVPGLLQLVYSTAQASNASGYAGDTITMTSTHRASLDNTNDKPLTYLVKYKLRDHNGKQTESAFKVTLKPHESSTLYGSLYLRSPFPYSGIYTVYADTTIEEQFPYTHISHTSGFGYVTVTEKPH